MKTTNLENEVIRRRQRDVKSIVVYEEHARMISTTVLIYLHNLTNDLPYVRPNNDQTMPTYSFLTPPFPKRIDPADATQPNDKTTVKKILPTSILSKVIVLIRIALPKEFRSLRYLQNRSQHKILQYP